MKKCHGNTKNRRFPVLQIGKKFFSENGFRHIKWQYEYASVKKIRLASVGILEKEREPGIGKVGWHGNFDMGFERNTDYDEITKNPENRFFRDISGSGDRNFLFFFQISGSVKFWVLPFCIFASKFRRFLWFNPEKSW